MADSVLNVSGYDTSYGIDAFLVHEEGSPKNTTDYRQIVALGGDSSAAGATVTVANNALTTSSHDVTVHTKLTEIDTAIDTIDGVLDNILTKNTEIDAVLDTIKVDTEAIETATEAIQVDAAAMEVLLTGIDADTDAIKTDAAAMEVLLTAIDADTNAIKVDTAANEVLLTAIDTVLDTIKVDTEAIETAVEGTLDVAIQPSTSSYLSHVYIDLDATGDNPATNTEVIAAPGASNKLVIYGVQGSIVGSADSAAGNWYLSDGNTSAATTLWTGRAQGLTNTQFELTFPYGVALTANTALKVTSTESSGHIFINAVIYYRTEAT
jgi:hypothetical protein